MIILKTQEYSKYISWTIQLLENDIQYSDAYCTITYNSSITTRTQTYYDNAVCRIQHIFTNENMRNCGYATTILNVIINKCKKENIHLIVLDDCTDNFNKQNNIYVKVGFTYIMLGYPEMIYRVNNM
jgi:hypothetical protein